jgi:hypothetical protein
MNNANKVGQLKVLEIIGLESLSSILHEKSYETSLSKKMIVNENHFFPKTIINSNSNLLEHILFSLKHETYNLFALMAGLRNVSIEDIESELIKNPNGVFARKAAFLWENANNTEINSGIINVSSKYIDFFDSEKYITGTDKKNSKWRVNFNGIGDLNWCPVIVKTKELESLFKEDIVKKTILFLKKTDKRILDRAIEWSYLSETKGSFAIENEKPSQKKSEAFVNLLKKSKDNEIISEEYLCQLQNEVVNSPFDQAVSYRTEQNWLQREGSRGVSSITYVPPEPILSDSIMKSIENLANNPGEIDPVCLASAISFGFVFTHPFMDGNGRISRFLIHHALNKSPEMPKNILLPISVAMKDNESDYLSSLEKFSLPARKFCDVQYIGIDDFSFSWKRDADLFFRFPELTEQTVFLSKMADLSLTKILESEIEFLTIYDRIEKTINDNYDIRGNILAEIISSALNNNGVISKNKLKKFSGYVMPDVLEQAQLIITNEIHDFHQEKSESGQLDWHPL